MCHIPAFQQVRHRASVQYCTSVSLFACLEEVKFVTCPNGLRFGCMISRCNLSTRSTRWALYQYFIVLGRISFCALGNYPDWTNLLGTGGTRTGYWNRAVRTRTGHIWNQTRPNHPRTGISGIRLNQDTKIVTEITGIQFGRPVLSIPPFETSRQDLQDGHF